MDGHLSILELRNCQKVIIYSSFLKGGGRRPEDLRARNPSPFGYSLYKRENNAWKL